VKIMTSMIATTVLLALAGGANADKETYDTRCAACHISGLAGAPVFGDKAEWAPLIATGMDAMLAVTIKGKGAMTPRGGCSDCTDAQLKSAIQFMVDAAK